MKWWLWRKFVTDQGVTESALQLQRTRERQPEVDELQRRAEELMQRNHFAENMHRALKGLK